MAATATSTLAPPPLSTAERSLVLSALLNSDPPHRPHNRPPLQFRPIHLETDVLPSAHGSARLRWGVGGSGSGFEMEAVTEVLVGVSVEVGKGGEEEDAVTCSVEVDPALQHSISPQYSTESISNSLTTLLSSALRPTASSGDEEEEDEEEDSIFPLSQRTVIPSQSHWHFYIDITILSLSAGNLVDATFAAAFAALSDVRIPRTRPVRFRAEGGEGEEGRQKGDELGLIKQKKVDRAVDFELVQDETGFGGDRLKNWEKIPVCVTVSLLPQTVLLDADATESLVVPSQIHVIASATGQIYSVHFAGPGGFWEASQPTAEGGEKKSLPPGMWDPNESIQRGMGSRFEAVKNAIKVGVNSASALATVLCKQIEEQQRKREERLLAG
ncbi:hypothetical protein CF326_g671 [Tilletia indica]|nr:hypothetical protein CF326_g671 [Tilletia indica]